jgi:hypothetical protein
VMGGKNKRKKEKAKAVLGKEEVEEGSLPHQEYISFLSWIDSFVPHVKEYFDLFDFKETGR